MDKTKVVAVVMGGPAAESEISLATGKSVAIALREKGYQVKEIYLEPRNFSEQLKKSGADVVFIAVHGLFGEDGRLQSALEMMDVPYTGSGVLSSAICMNKIATKRVLVGSGVPTPDFLFLYKKDGDIPAMARAVKEKFSLPVVIKPASQGSSIGISIEKDADKIEEDLKLAFSYDEEVLVEQYVPGHETSICMMRTKDGIRTFPPILIKPHGDWYDFTTKYTAGCVDHLCPAPLPEKETARLKEISEKAYEVLGCDGIARTDCITDPEGNCFVLEMNTVPGMTPTSLVPDAAAAEGITFADLCEMILDLAHK